MDISEAREVYRGKVIIWYQMQLGGQLKDRSLWVAEKNGEVLDYHGKNTLIASALAAGEEVVVLRLHKNGQVSAKEICR
jgi:hypothetical protein